MRITDKSIPENCLVHLLVSKDLVPSHHIHRLDRLDRIAVGPDPTKVAVTVGYNQVVIYDLRTGQPAVPFDVPPKHYHGIHAMTYSLDGTKLLVGNQDGFISWWDTITGCFLRKTNGHHNTVYGLAFSPDGRYLASGSYDKTINIRDATTDTRLDTIYPGHSAYGLTFSPDSKTLLVAGGDNNAKLFSVETRQTVLKVNRHAPGLVSDVSFNKTGSKFITISRNSVAYVHDTATGEPYKRFQNYHSLATFSPDGRRLAATSGLYIVIYDVTDEDDYKPIQRWKAHHSAILEIAFTADSTKLVSTSIDQTAKVWMVAESPDIDHLLSVPPEERDELWKAHIWDACQEV